MANPLKYTTSQPTKPALRKGNLALGIGGAEYGPTSTTGYYNGIEIPDGGLVVYTIDTTNDPIGYVVNSEDDLPGIARTLGGSEDLTVLEAKSYLAALPGTWILDSVPSKEVTDDLVLYLKASSLSSYPQTGSTWYDLSGNDNNSLLTNFTFDGLGVGILDTSSLINNVEFNGVNGKYSLSITTKLKQSFDTLEIITTPISFSYSQSDQPITKFNNFVFTFEKDNDILEQKTYLNSELVLDTVSTNSLYNLGFPINVKVLTDSTVGTSSINQMKTYDKILTQSEILQNYYQAPIVTDGLVLAIDAGNLVSYESGSTNAYSLTGSVTSTLQNGTAYLPNNGGTWDFDGTNDYLSFDSNSTRTNLGITSYFTFDIWINADSTVYGGDQFGFAGYAPYWGYTMRTALTDSSTKILAYLYYQDSNGNWVGSYNSSISNKGNIGEWVNFVITFDNGLVTHYVNGKAGTSTTLALTGQNPTQNLGYGIIGWSYYEGKFANGKIYNKALTAEEVSQNFNAQRNKFNI